MSWTMGTRILLFSLLSVALSPSDAFADRPSKRKQQPPPPQYQAQGGLRYTIGVADFANESNWRGQFDLGHNLGIVLTDLLQNSARFIVVGEDSMRSRALEEQDLVASGRAASGQDTPQSNHMTPAQLIVRGVITHVQDDTAQDAGGVSYRGISLNAGRRKAEINVTFYVVDATTGQVHASRSVTGESSKRAFGIKIQRDGAETGFSTQRDDNLMNALAVASEQAVLWMANMIDALPWQGSVVRVADSVIFINRGAREGVQPGMRLAAGTMEVIRDPSTGEVLESLLHEEAQLEVQSVQDRLSRCRVSSGDVQSIRAGMAVTHHRVP